MALSDATPEAQTLRLYENDVSPAEGDTTATYTEATIAGYSQKSLVRATWNPASTDTGTTSKTYPQQSWTFTGAGTIYGYYIVKATAGTILWAERVFGSGQAFQNTDQFLLTVRIELA